MAIRRAEYIFGIFFIMFVTGCATGISQQSRSKVTYMGTFSKLQKTPDVYDGEVVIFGGKILETKVSSTLSELTVLQLEQLLDPAIYQKGMLLTVVGMLKGSKVRAIGDFDYAYPLLEAIEIKLWPKEVQTHPRFHFGFGVGTTF